MIQGVLDPRFPGKTSREILCVSEVQGNHKTIQHLLDFLSFSYVHEVDIKEFLKEFEKQLA